MNLVKKSLLGLAMISTLVGAGNAEAASFSIDTFEYPGDFSDFISTQGFPGQNSKSMQIGNDNSIIGGYRDVSLVQEFSTMTPVGANVFTSDGSLSLSNATDVDSTLSIVWDGDDSPDSINYIGLGGIDLTQSGELEGILVNVLSNDLNMDITFNIYTDELNFSTATLNFAAGSTDIDAFFAFDSLLNPGDNRTEFSNAGTSGGADFTNVGAIEMIIGGDPELDAKIAFVESSIEPPTDIPESNLSLICLVGIAGLGTAIRKRNLKH